MVDLVRDIQIGIGSARSKKGAAEVNAAQESIIRKSRKLGRAGEKSANKFAASLKRLAKVAAVVATAFAFRGIIKSQIAFGQAVSDLSAITGAVGKDLDFLRQKSKEFGETTTLSASQAAEAFKVIASAKPDLLENVEALAAVTEEAIALAEATGESLPVAANTLGAALNQFSAGADQASRFINVLAAGSKRGAALVGEMSESLRFAGTIAAQAGLSFEETNAALQLMSTFAIKGSEAGTQLRMVLLQLSTQSQSQFSPEVHGLRGALDNLAAANLSTAEAAKLFGARNVAVGRILISQREKLSKLTEQLTGTNIAYEQQAIRVDNLSGDIKALKSAYEGLELTIGSQLNSAFRGLTQAATESIRALSKNPLIQGGVGKALDFIHRVVQDIQIVFGQLSDWFVNTFDHQIAVTFGIFEGAIENIKIAAKFLWEEFVVRGPANLKLGFTLMIEAADQLKSFLVEKFKVTVFLIIQQFKRMAGAVGEVFDDIKTSIGAAIDAIIGAVQQKLFGLARSLANLGFDDMAEDVINLSKAIGGIAKFEDEATEAAERNAAVRRRVVEIIDEMIAEAEALGKAQRDASDIAVAAAIAERDATVAVIEALRTKRQVIEDGAASVAVPAGGGGTTTVAEEGIDAFKELGDIQQSVVDSMSDGIADFAAQGKLDFKDFANSVIQDIIRIAIRAKAIKLFSSLFGGFGGGGEIEEAIPTGGVGAAGGSFIPPSGVLSARHGAEFKVGGSGGPDSQFVAFKASPNETVTITNPGQSKGGGNINLNFEYTIIADGADAEKFQAQVPAMLDKTRKAAVADILLMKKQGVFLRP